MTAVVGISCSDGIVIGTDSSITTMQAGSIAVIEQRMEKLAVIDGKIVIAGTGDVGLGQRFRNIVEKASASEVFQKPPDANAKPIDLCCNISRMAIDNFSFTNAPKNYSALVAAPIWGTPVLCEFDNGLQPTIYDKLPFCSMGSTQAITDTFLAFMSDTFWPEGQPTVERAILAVTWTLDHAIAVNPGGVNGPAQIAALEKKRNAFEARLLSDDDLNEHRSWIASSKRYLSERLRDVDSAPNVPRLTRQQRRQQERGQV